MRTDGRNKIRHPGKGRGPGLHGNSEQFGFWIPAFAGMTKETGVAKELQANVTQQKRASSGGPVWRFPAVLVMMAVPEFPSWLALWPVAAAHPGCP